MPKDELINGRHERLEDSIYGDELYIHTNKYDIVVSKAKFWSLINYKSNSRFWSGKIEYKTLFGIYCYRDGCTRFSFKGRLESKRSVLEIYLDDFETEINGLLKNYQS